MFPITLESHRNIIVLRDDLLPGGTKSILLDSILPKDCEQYIYATPVYGGFQIALSMYCQKNNKKAVLFCGKRKKKHVNTIICENAGAIIHELPVGYLTVSEYHANLYCVDKNRRKSNFAYKVPFGAFDKQSVDLIKMRMTKIVSQLGYEPDLIICAVGSGTLVQGILQGTEKAKIIGVMVGRNFQFSHSRLELIHHHLPFEKETKVSCPFPSMSNYDRKAWEYCVLLRELKELNYKTILFWNVL